MEQSHFDQLIDSFTEIKKVVFLRRVDTRWLQIVSVVERVMHLYEPLMEYFSKPNRKGTSSNFTNIRAELNDPRGVEAAGRIRIAIPKRKHPNSPSTQSTA